MKSKNQAYTADVKQQKQVLSVRLISLIFILVYSIVFIFAQGDWKMMKTNHQTQKYRKKYH